MHELLAPAAPLREELYGKEFVGMTRHPVSWDALIETRRRLHADIGSRLTGEVADFLISLHDAEPDFGLIGVPEAAEPGKAQASESPEAPNPARRAREALPVKLYSPLNENRLTEDTPSDRGESQIVGDDTRDEG